VGTIRGKCHWSKTPRIRSAFSSNEILLDKKIRKGIELRNVEKAKNYIEAFEICAELHVRARTFF